MWIEALLIALGLLVGIGSYKYLGMKEDNPVEETCEQIIKMQTGQDIDLSPNSKVQKEQEKIIILDDKDKKPIKEQI